jgi:hypothetical protein
LVRPSAKNQRIGGKLEAFAAKMQPDYAKNTGNSDQAADFLSESGTFMALTSGALVRSTPDEQPFCNAD